MKISKNFAIIAAVVILCSDIVHAQDRIEAHIFNSAKGLQNREISGIAESQDGMLWFASENGLICFDGYEFCTFKSDRHNLSYLADNSLKSVAAIKDLIAFSGKSGIEILDRKDRKVTTVRDSLVTGKMYRCILFTEDGNLIAAGQDGVIVYSLSTGKVERIACDDGSGENILTNARILHKDRMGNIWIGTWKKGVFLLRCGENKAEKINADLPEKLFITGFADIGNRVYVSTWSEKIYVLNSTAAGFKSSTVDTGQWGLNTVYSMCKDKDDNLWLGGPEGVRIINAKGDNLKELKENLPKGIVDCADVRSLFCDKVGNIWIADNSRGIVEAQFTNHFIDEISLGFSEAIPASVTSVYLDEGGILWAGVRNRSIVKYDTKTGTVLQNEPFLSAMDLYDNSVVSTIGIPARGKIVFATKYYGIFCAEVNGSQVKKMRALDPSVKGIRNSFTNKAVKGPGDIIWIATNKGLVLMSPDENDFELIEPEDLNRAIGYSQVVDIIYDKKNRLWLATDDCGIYCIRYDLLNLTMQSCRRYSKSDGNIANDRIRCLYEDSKGDLWAGDAVMGLYEYDPSGDCFSIVPDMDLFPSDEICAITEDKDGRLWITTSNGFLCYDPSHPEKVVFSSSSNENFKKTNFMPGAIYSDGRRIFMGSRRALSVFYADKMTATETASTPIITSIKVKGKDPEGVDAMPPFTKKMKLKHRMNDISFTFASPETKNEWLDVKYAYKLSNSNKGEWTYVSGKDRTVNYVNLRTGRYTFKVKASSSVGRWSDETVLKFRILPAVWQSWWFIALVIIIVGTITYLFKKILRKRDELAKDLEKIRNEISNQTTLTFDTDHDREFIDKAVKIIESHLSESEFDVDDFNREMNMSNSTLYRKMKNITGMAPKEFIRSIRFKYACHFLKEKSINVSDVAFMVGFSNSKYFTQSFKKEFGMTPSQYIKEQTQTTE